MIVYYGALRSNAPSYIPISAISRPTPNLTQFYNALGDSTTFGVGAPAGSSYPGLFRTATVSTVTAAFNMGVGGESGASIVDIGNGGQGGQNSTFIKDLMTTNAGTYPTQMSRTHFWMAGLNDYNTAVSGWARNWPAQVKANYAASTALVTGGYKNFCWAPISENDRSDGMRNGADHRFYCLDMQATYPSVFIDTTRYMIHARRLAGITPGTADDNNVNVMGCIPYQYRGSSGSTAFAQVDFAPIFGTAAPTDLNYPEGTIFYNTVALQSYRKFGASGAGSWQLTDTKHQSAWGNTVLAQLATDLAMAVEGNGPPVVLPISLKVAANAAAGTVVGQVKTVGTATQFSLRGYGDVAVNDFLISSTGEITKATNANITEGLTELVCLAKNANGVLSGPVAIYVTRPTTVTAPQMRTIASPGVTITGRDAHGMADGTKFSFAFWVNPASLTNTPYLALLSRSPTSPILVRLTANGSVGVVVYDNTNTLIGNFTTTAGTVSTGSPFWILGSFDAATNTRTVYVDDTVRTVAASYTGTGASFMADTNPIFLGASNPKEFTNGVSVFTGQIGYMAWWDDYVDWTVQANRRMLHDASNNPVARTAYAAIGGKVPKFELFGGKGDWQWGSPDGSYGASLLSMSYKAKTLMT